MPLIRIRNVDRTSRVRQRGAGVVLLVFILGLWSVFLCVQLVRLVTVHQRGAGDRRDSSQIFAASEAGVAFAQHDLLAKIDPQGPGCFTALLASRAPLLCVRVNGAYEIAGNAPAVPGMGDADVRYCVHNDPDDPAARRGAADTNDDNWRVTIQVFARTPGGARARIEAIVEGAAAPGPNGNPLPIWKWRRP